MRRPAADDLSIGGLTDAGRQLKQIADALSRIASGQQRLSVSGPGARFAAAQRNAFLARAVGDPLQQRDAALALSRAQRGFSGPGLADRLTQFVRTTRFGAGGVSPLVGRGLDVLGAGGGPVALAATAAAAALKGLAEVTVGTVQRMNEMGDAVRISGGTPGQVARLAAMGITPGEATGRAAALQRTITETPFGRMGGVQAGLAIRPGLSAPANQLANYEKALEYLRQMGPTQERLILARRLGMEEELKHLDVSNETLRVGREIAATSAAIFSPEKARAANDLAHNFDAFFLSLKNLGGAAAGGTLGNLNEFFRGAAEGADFLAKSLQGGGLRNLFGRLLTRDPVGLGLDIAGAGASPEQAWKELARIQQELIGETRENTAALRSQAPREGMFGGGEWARSALGRGMQGLYLGQALQGNALRMGAFRL